MPAAIRAVSEDPENRTFQISFSSEEPYDQLWVGPEILDHSDGAVNLDRLNSIGVVLYNHDRDKVVGRIDKAWTEDGRGLAQITFDEDEDSDVIYQKVKSGTLKGVSVGYIVSRYEVVDEGEKSKDGRFDGPVSVATSWEPLEVSIVSIPADPTVGVGRDYDVSMDNHRSVLAIAKAQMMINKNYLSD